MVANVWFKRKLFLKVVDIKTMYYSLEDRNVAEIGTGPTLFFPKFGLEPESTEELETNRF